MIRASGFELAVAKLEVAPGLQMWGETMLKKLLMTAAILAVPVAANAADVATKAAPRFAPAPAPYNWTGFYIGANVGYGLGNVVIDDKDCNLSCSSQTLNPNGFTAGGTIGYNWQYGSTVWGIEGDWNWIDAKKTIFIVIQWEDKGKFIPIRQFLFELRVVKERIHVTNSESGIYSLSIRK